MFKRKNWQILLLKSFYPYLNLEFIMEKHNPLKFLFFEFSENENAFQQYCSSQQ
jgi:hypothetical protein